MSHPQISTPFGDMEVIPCGLHTVKVSNNGNKDLEPITVNRVDMRATITVNRGNEGWKTKREYTYTSRVPWDAKKDVSYAAKKKLETTIEKLIEDWAKNNQDILIQAEIDSNQRDIERLEDKIDEGLKNLHEWKTKKEELEMTNKNLQSGPPKTCKV